METVVTVGTGKNYYMDGYNLIAKTGTAQISSTNGKGYLRGEYDYIRGFAGMFPKDDPKIIIYGNVKRPVPAGPQALTYVIKDVVENISKYYKIYDKDSMIVDSKNYKLDSYYNKDIDTVKTTLNNNGLDVIVIGDGNTIVNQYPTKGITTTKGNKVFLVTNSTNYMIPNFYKWSRTDVLTYLRLTKIPFKINGIGYLTSQNIVGVPYSEGMELELTFEEKFSDDPPPEEPLVEPEENKQE